MKLNEIKTVMTGYYNLSEGVVPVHLVMTLEQIISAGKVTNSAQHFIMAGLMSLYKEGGPARWPRDLNSYPMGTSSELVEAVKGLTATESVEMAQWLLDSLYKTAAYESTPYYDAEHQTVADWMRYVIRKQD